MAAAVEYGGSLSSEYGGCVGTKLTVEDVELPCGAEDMPATRARFFHCDGKGIANQHIIISIDNGRLCDAQTDDDGWAECVIPCPPPSDDEELVAAFDGGFEDGSPLSPREAHGTLTVVSGTTEATVTSKPGVGSLVTLECTLVPPIPFAGVEFNIGSSVASATTGIDGVARIKAPITGSKQVSCSYEGSQCSDSAESDTITVGQESGNGLIELDEYDEEK